MAAAMLAAYDALTAGHSDDVVTLCAAVAGQFDLTETRRSHLLAAAQLHDIGKVAVPAGILDKPGKLSPSEWEEMRRHTLSGEQILASVPELTEVGQIVRHSHERYDGTGYPDGIAGDEIPLESRIVLCADAFHAIRCDRPYRRGRSAAEAMKEVGRNSGTQFDPLVVDALERTAGTLRRSAAQRVAAMTDGVRSRRLVALLLTLAVSGSALAAPGSPFHGLLFGKDGGEAQASTCVAPCLPAQLGPFGRLPSQNARGAVEAVAAGLPALARSGIDRASLGGSGGPGGAGVRLGPRGGGPSRASQGTGGSTQTPGVGRPVSPGRSGEAPRRPASPGKPSGPGPGRSDEAPGKPTGPGKFGHN